MIFIKDNGNGPKRKISSFFHKKEVIAIFVQIKRVLFDAKAIPGLPQFLKAAFFGLCAINTLILFMGVYLKKVLGIDMAVMINLIAFSTIFGIAGSLLSGHFSDRFGPRRCLIVIFFIFHQAPCAVPVGMPPT